MELKMTRRRFLLFFFLGGLLGIIRKRLHHSEELREASFWKRI